MATIAKAMITLTNVNDAYSVVLSPDSCVIKADFDGTNPNLDAAFTDITVVRGETKHAYKLEVAAISNSAITYQLGSIDAYTKRIKLTNIPSDTLSGYLSFMVSTDDDYVATVTFQYSVVRETSMLDWILDWENNKTKIGDSYLITPKLFVGKKVENEDGLKKLTGVYIGPDTVNTAGIYGYKEGEDVFHVNALGAMIGGWEINKAGITTSNDYGYVKLLSDGNISYSNIEGDVIWKLGADGNVKFAKGNVTFNANGNAYFSGEILAKVGKIAGWKISSYALHNEYVRLDSASRLIGVCGHQSSAEEYGSDFIADIYQYGGVYMNYMASGNYGLRGYLPGVKQDDVLSPKQTFALGSENKIANWYFDNNSLYMGTKVNMTGHYTNDAKDITIGSQGLRGSSWYIDNDGSVSFAKGMIELNEDGGTIVGWELQINRFGSTHAVLVSDSALAGLYLSKDADFTKIASANLKSTIKSKGGIYLCTDGVTAELYASDSSAKQTFYLTTNGTNKIANWYFDKEAVYIGTKAMSGYTSSSGSITIGGGGIRGYKWKLEDDGAASFSGGNVLFNSDGSGSLASGNISWDKSGNVSFSNSVKLSWQTGINEAKTAASNAQKAAGAAQSTANNAVSGVSDVSSKYTNLFGTYLTYIGSDGIYTGTLAADKIAAGTISSCSIQSSANSPTWKLNSDGSGSLASGNISWDKSGNVKVEGEINATSGKIGGFKISSNYIGIDNGESNSTSGLFLYNDMIGFNGNNRQTIIGVCNFTGTEYLGRFLDSKKDFIDRNGVVLGVTGSCTNNNALILTGGRVSGLNYKVESYGLDQISQTYDSNGNKTSPPTRLDVYLKRDVTCVAVSTQYTWKAIGSTTWEKKTRDVYIHLPDMKQYDDGHILFIKRIANSGSGVYVVPSKSYKLSIGSSYGTYNETSGNSCILANGNGWYTSDSPLLIESEGDAMQFIYFRDLSYSVTKNNVTTTYNGWWIQWKNPREW